MPEVILVMGPTGSGKTTVGAALAARLGVPFLDADDFCPAESRAKMTASIQLTDEDRYPWLETLNRELRRRAEPRIVLSCSAQKEVYRQRLLEGLPERRIIHLCGSAELLRRRMEGRRGHFMPVSLLAGQIALMEAPADCLSIHIGQPPATIVEAAAAYCG